MSKKSAYVSTDRINTERQQWEAQLTALSHELDQSNILQLTAQAEELHDKHIMVVKTASSVLVHHIFLDS